jgi:hypothetical protein
LIETENRYPDFVPPLAKAFSQVVPAIIRNCNGRSSVIGASAVEMFVEKRPPSGPVRIVDGDSGRRANCDVLS